MKYYAFAKYYSVEESEKGAETVIRYIERARRGEETLLSSLLLVGGVISVFDKWHRKHLITQEDLQEQLSFLVEDLQELINNGGLILEPISPLVFVSSLRFIIEYHLSVGDALHLYTALMYLPKDEEFVSSDTRLNLAAQAKGFMIVNPEE